MKKMNRRKEIARWIGIAVTLLVFGHEQARAQSQIELSGLFYMDYEYIAASSDSGSVGDNGFRYRRVYLTTDFEISEEFSGRARLEAQTSRLSAGKPLAFVKDLWLKWKGALGEGHDAVFGVQSPPSFTASEKAWGYRSLERSIMDRNGAVGSRDFGVQLKGQFAKDGQVGYGIMFGNNSSVIGETNRGKRLYGQLSWTPSDRVSMTIGGDYATDVPFSPDDTEANRANANAFASYDAGKVRVGAEGYYRQTSFDGLERSDFAGGVSVWVIARVASKAELIARVDRVDREIDQKEIGETFVLVGLAFLPHKQVRFIPNVWISKFDSNDNPTVLGRVTIHADF